MCATRCPRPTSAPRCGAGWGARSWSSWPAPPPVSPRWHRHELSTPGHPRIADEHYPDYPPGNGPHERPLRPGDDAERAFLALGDGAERWLREACAAGVARIRIKMADACELAALFGSALVDRALRMAALAGRFAERDVAAIVEHLEHPRAP